MIERGYGNVTVDDIAAAAGIGRRTFFRYFPSKNDLMWGAFDELLDAFRRDLAQAPPDAPIVQAVHAAVRRFNRVPVSERERHRHRMRLLLEEPELIAHAAVRYAAWRGVIADYVARRTGSTEDSVVPQAVSWACLGISLSAYRQWVRDPDTELLAAMDESFRGLREVFADAAWGAGDGE
ncbi:mycofactocin system transcriptional regulator [Microbacterium sp. SORGH_AS 888]|nr:mycofactocin system transcriptional regulator [Microbacterium sp. SORGH_AS_0888]